MQEEKSDWLQTLAVRNSNGECLQSFQKNKKKKDWDPMFRSPTKVRLMFEVSRKISSTVQGFKKIHRPVPFGIRNLEKYSRLSSREEANLRPESGEALYKKTKGVCLLNRKI